MDLFQLESTASEEEQEAVNCIKNELTSLNFRPICDARERRRNLLKLIHADFNKAMEMGTSDRIGISALTLRVDFLIWVFGERVQAMAVLGWNHNPEEVISTTSLFLHYYFSELCRYFSKMFTDSIFDSLSIENQAEVCALFFKFNRTFGQIVQRNVAVFCVSIVPMPRLTDFFEDDMIAVRFSIVVYDKMKVLLQEELTSSRSESKRKLLDGPPWISVTKSGSSWCRSMIQSNLEKKMAVLLHPLAFKQEEDEEVDSHVTAFNARIRTCSFKSFLILIALYRLHVSRFWSSREDRSKEQSAMWLCSVCNDLQILKTNHSYHGTPVLKPECLIDERILTNLGIVSTECIEALACRTMDSMFAANRKTLPPADCAKVFARAVLFYHMQFSDTSLLDLFNTMCADKMIPLYLSWIADRVVVDKGKALPTHASVVLDTLASAGGPAALINRCRLAAGSLLSKSTTFNDFKVQLFPTEAAPMWVSDQIMALMEKLFTSLRAAATTPSSKTGAVLSYIGNKKDEAKNILKEFIKEEEELIEVLCEPQIIPRQTEGTVAKRITSSVFKVVGHVRRGIFRNSTDSASSATTAEKVDDDLQPWLAHDDENILLIKTIVGLDLFGCDDKLEFFAIKTMNLEMKIVSDRVDNEDSLHLTLAYSLRDGKAVWEPEIPGPLHVRFRGKISGVQLQCVLSYTTKARFNHTFGKILIPLREIDALREEEEKDYAVVIFSKKLEDRMQLSHHASTKPALRFMLSLL